MTKQRICVQRNVITETFDIFVFRRDSEKQGKEYARISWEPWPELEERPPTMMVEFERAQELFEALWSAGIRPPGHKMTEYNAQTKHLEDMRALTFGKMGIEKPK